MRRIDLLVCPCEYAAMDPKAAQVATVCECIDHCFAFAMWCDDFAQHVDPDDMMMGLDRAFDLISDATRLHSFLALRKLDDFFGGVKPKPNDLTPPVNSPNWGCHWSLRLESNQRHPA